MGRLMIRLVLVLALAAVTAFVVAGATGWGVMLGIAVAAVVGSRAFRCHHPGSLGLLPPRSEADGTKVPARWFCDACGKTWPAVFERAQQPVRRFEGFDQSKAPEAARRADELYKRQHAMALRRAGFEGSTRRIKVERPPAAIVAIAHARRFVK